MRLRTFAICPVCAELYPTRRGCPSCDRDEVAAMEVAAARRALSPRGGAGAVDAPAEQVTVIDPWRRTRSRPLVAALSLGLLFGTVLLVFLSQA